MSDELRWVEITNNFNSELSHHLWETRWQLLY